MVFSCDIFQGVGEYGINPSEEGIMSMTIAVLEPGTPGSLNPVGPDWAGTLMTPEEFDAASQWDESYNYELIHGVLVVSPPPSEAERGPNELLGNLLYVYRRTHPDGRSLDATLPEHHVKTPANRRRADRVIWTGLGHAPNPSVDLPSIVVEFVSPGKRSRFRDYEAKRQEYLDAGVREYWVFDRFRRQLTVYRPDGAATEFAETSVYRTSLLPGFDVPLVTIFREADEWSSSRA
jgi:Uma2 family endonuclease